MGHAALHIASVVHDDPEVLRFESLTIVCAPPTHNHATVILYEGTNRRVFESNGGNGPVDAICGALQELSPGFRVKHCSTKELEEGSDARAEALVELSGKSGGTYHGKGTDTNTLYATTEAIIDALHKLRWSERKQLRGAV